MLLIWFVLKSGKINLSVVEMERILSRGKTHLKKTNPNQLGGISSK